MAQQPEWRPSRIPSNSSARPLASATNTSTVTHTASTVDSEQLGSGVTLRWKSTAPRSTTGIPNVVTASDDQQPVPNSPVRWAGGGAPAAVPAQSARRINTGDTNPLRSGVASSSYQEDAALPQNPFGDDVPSPPPSLFDPGLPPLNPADLPAAPQNTLPNTDLNPQRPDLPDLADPLLIPEQAPNPGSIMEQDGARNPFPGRGSEDPSPRDNTEEPLPPPSQTGDEQDQADQREELEAPKRLNADSNLASCDEQRQRLKSRPLQAIDLDVSPSYGEGLRSVKKDTEQERLDFAAGSDIRDWSDYTGMIITSGRLIDLRDDRAILDVGGNERAIPLRTLSDVDIAYIGKSWNIPTVCGTGYERFEGRNFVPATVQWTASGLCHKPLYFEQVQLERYGHETGPLLQPLISTAHFFGNIAILPYKMGIHPPNECQYSLGYIRPGNCAPYMVQPFPWSLRGAVAQASFVTGAAALIP
ncbi:MAG: hypothetical protein R3C53_23910 [Pirellulaceae bacterium]